MPFPFRAILKYPPPIIILLLAPTLPLFGQPHYVAPGCNDGNHGTLKSCEGKVPTPPGPVLVSWENGDTFKLSLTLPAGMSAQAQLPADKNSTGVFLGGQPVRAHRDGPWWILDQDVTGMVAIETRQSVYASKMK